MENQNNANSLTAMLSGASFAMINDATGLFNNILNAAHISEDVFKAGLVGFVGAIAGLAGKALYTWLETKTKAFFKS